MEKDLTLNHSPRRGRTDTLAHAVLNPRGDHFESAGKAQSNPIDQPMPVIGEELVLARALHDLAGQVMEAANTKIEDFLTS